MNTLICRSLWISQSVNSIIDHPKMPLFSKKANLLKDLEAIAKSHTIKAYLHFCLDEEDITKMLDPYMAVKLAFLKYS